MEQNKASIAFKTLGCRLNQFETDALVSHFDQKGYTIAPFKAAADITVINTCTVTSQSDHKSRNIIKQAIAANPGSTIVVTGCMAEQYKAAIEKIEGVSLVITNAKKAQIVEQVEAYRQKQQTNLADNLFSYRPVQKSLHTRAAIKIQDGCDNLCTFCIIPKVRGRAVSRPVKEILENIEATLQNGFKEIIITGVNIGRYEHEGTNFTGLMRQILAIEGDFRVRISSLEPDGFGEDFIELFQNPKLTPHLHLCIQSGSDKILLRMRRMYTLDIYRAFVDKLFAAYPDFNLTTDLIVGFPSEDEDMFKESLNIVKQIAFSHVHTFKYSIRSGTPAERMLQQVDEREKTARSARIREQAERNKKAYYSKFVGQTQRVLVEKSLGNNRYFGYGENYIPIIFEHQQFLKNEFVSVKVEGLMQDKDELKLKGQLIGHGKFAQKKINVA